MNHIPKRMFALLLAVLLLTSACKTNIARKSDGSFHVETTISQQELQDVISSSLADPLVKNVTVSLQPGYVLVLAERERLNDNTKADTLSFQLDLGVSNSQLTSSIANAQIDGVAVEQNRVDLWNQKVTNRLAILGKKNEKSTLQSISITTAAVTLTWVLTK